MSMTNIAQGPSRTTVHGDQIAWAPAPKSSADVSVYDTLPKILSYNAKNFASDVAQREKEFGIWNIFTWQDFYDHVSRMSLGMAKLGITSGDTVVLIGDNRVEWVWGELAAHSCRAMSMGIYRDALEDEIAYLTDYTLSLIHI